MLNMKNNRLRAIVLFTICVLILAAGATKVRAQGFCRQVRAHPFDVVTACRPYGCYPVRVPCVHWFNICD
jgi:hypothetical protein